MNDLPPEVQKRVHLQQAINGCETPRDAWEYLGIEVVCHLDRIATALESLEESGIHTYPQDDPKSDTVESKLGRRRE